ncbi:MAG: GDSL-type esterase/lipase family protein [Verrucomicrobiota bacterium]
MKGFAAPAVSLLLLSQLHAGKPMGDDAFGALRAMEPSNAEKVPIANSWQPRVGEVVAFLGGTNVVQEQFDGHLEALLHQTWPEEKLRCRNLAWQADTVYRQQRPQYFYDSENRDQRAGSTYDTRKRIQPDTIFVRFGKMESLDGMEALPRFRDAYGKLLDRLMAITPRVIVVTPTPFFEAGPAARLAEARNQVLVTYCMAMAELSGERDLFFADLYQFEPDRDYSPNGIHLNDAGKRAVAERLLMQLVNRQVEVDWTSTEAIRAAIQRKNQIWYQYFRPTNWAFLYGDRQHVPSSRDHEDSEKRWFPFELERALPRITGKEARIYELAKP